MKNKLKWILAIGAILSGFLLVWALMLNVSWMGQFSPVEHGMFSGGHRASFGGMTSFVWFILGPIVFLLVIAGLFLASRSKPDANPALSVGSDPLKLCPDCAGELEPDWKNCPSCGCDLS
jgi:hypothetical protein